MAKLKTTKDQSRLTQFFKSSKKDKDASESSDRDASDVEGVVEQQASAKVNNKLPPDQSDLPPINDLPAIFADLVERIPQIKGVAERVQGRKLRVATMCSGTESPLLALGLIHRSIKEKYGVSLEVEHVFSCEIEPFKQAYIERNFRPPILFRDVCELGDDEATTAYGSRVPVPGDVDILIAGTSCVDYSNLNNEKQDIEANGESGRTFRGMMSWVTKHRPPLVILENVCGAPWDKVQKYFQMKDYSADYMRVDTKNFYIPHTRTRVYLMAVDKKKSEMPEDWKNMLKQLYRPASSTLDAFLLPTDDPRIHQAREKLVKESFGGVDRRTGRTDWGRCESRHQRARLEEELGGKRPLTGWDEGGYCTLPDFAWNDWGVAQVQRVWDLMDISLLRAAKEGVDPAYKTQVWNLSQNVDRNIGTRPGICPCLTPSMIPYVTNRGGPMIGLEALSLQGLPVDELLLTRETEDQLADLAGNAMSTTVVGAGILVALVIGKKLLKGTSEEDTNDAMAVDEPDAKFEEIVGEDQLEHRPLDLTAVGKYSLSSLLSKADGAARLCECEGRTGVTTRAIRRCQDCSTTTCVKCGGRPEHNYMRLSPSELHRLSPTDFASELKAALPMCLSVMGINEDYLEKFRETSVPSDEWTTWCGAILAASKSELRFSALKRQEVWVATYSSSSASLELLLHPKRAEWRLFGKPEASLPANSPSRKLLALPVARCVCQDDLLTGTWEFALPRSESFPIEIKGIGELVPSWEARLGLQGAGFKDRRVYEKLEVTVPLEKTILLDRNISGTYLYLPHCGGANSSLHKKVNEDPNLLDLFFFIDPTRCGDASEDSFVFSTSKRRYNFGEARPIICSLDSKWRQSHDGDVKTVKCHVPYIWKPASTVQLQPAKHNATFAVPGDNLDIIVSADACASATAVLTCKVSLQGQAGPEWPIDTWRIVDSVHARSVFQSLAWIIERVKKINDQVDSWVEAPLQGQTCKCERCAPTPPRLEWKRIPGARVKVKPMENQSQAGVYEQALKHRPSAFITQIKLDKDTSIGHVRIGVNVPSLIHRAISRLPTEYRHEPLRLSWKLSTDYSPPAKLNLPKFKLSGNKRDPEHTQPPHFKIPLRPEQLRSLGWMIKQESPDASPFVEEEIAEAMLEPLGWRAEGKAQRPVQVRGGVLADEVGYGKTAITLGLIDSNRHQKKDIPPQDLAFGRIPVTGTLVIVPPHLTRQWAKEVKKFCGDEFEVCVISTAANLNSLTIQDIRDADIIIVASNLFKSSVYLANLEAFAAAGTLPNQEGRYFNVRLKELLASLKNQVELLKKEGATAVLEKIAEAEKTAQNDHEDMTLPSKRLKGKQYRLANDTRTLSSPEVRESSPGSEPAEKARESSPEHVRPKQLPRAVAPTPNLNLEVVIPWRPKKSSKSFFPAADSSDQDADSDLPSKKRPRRSIKSTTIIISDGETQTSGSEFEYDDDVAQKTHKMTTSDEEMSVDEEEDEEDDDDELSDDEETKRKVKKKAKAKPKFTAKPSRKYKGATQSDVDEEKNMDVETSSKPKGGKKRKSNALNSEDEDDNPKKKAKKDVKPKVSRAATDPWKLKSSDVKSKWKKMKSPPLEMFHFHRLVIDEYTYLDGKTHSLITNLQATCRWVLSGTPPVHDFPSLKTIAVFLDIHLGIDDDEEGQSAQIKKRRKDQTEVEKFHSFREVRSLDWHAHRHEVGQAFLDQFVRQNKPEIDEIPAMEQIEHVALPAAERAIYLELDHHLRALDMTIKRGRKNESDREKRLQKSLGESNSAEEALLKRCSHFDLETSDKDNAMKACEIIVKDRTAQLDECRADLKKNVIKALDMQKRIGKTEDESLFQEWLRVTRTEGVGDQRATDLILEILEQTGIVSGPLKTSTNTAIAQNELGKTAKQKTKQKGKEKSQDIADLIWEHREHAHDLRKLTKELVGRVRSLRYFTVVRDLQRQDKRDMPPVHCPHCKRTSLPISDIGVLSSCGHMGCLSCVLECAEKEECVYHGQGECNAAARALNVVKAETLGVDDDVRDGNGKHFGKKLEQAVQLIKERIPKHERVLIFVQFPDLMKKVNEALTANKIKFLEIKGSASMKSKNLDKFQEKDEDRVLLLNVTDESASGANLTSANHAIFLSPLLTPSQEIYDACETQAIGRLRRFGQTKLVHIWRFLTTETIDTEIFEKRDASGAANLIPANNV